MPDSSYTRYSYDGLLRGGVVNRKLHRYGMSPVPVEPTDSRYASRANDSLYKAYEQIFQLHGFLEAFCRRIADGGSLDLFLSAINWEKEGVTREEFESWVRQHLPYSFSSKLGS
jgi:hypothetical protein